MTLRKQKTFTLLTVIAVGISGTAEAALIDRGGGMIYDNVLDITWLQDANYVVTSGYAADHATAIPEDENATDNIYLDGRMGWDAANIWVADLSYEGYDDWRLPGFLGGGACSGGNCTDSELGHMFYNNMGATNGESILDGTNTANLALFDNIQSSVDWASVEWDKDGIARAWAFLFLDGSQSVPEKTFEYYAWAVRGGDVLSVPAPAPLWLVGSGLVAMFGRKRTA
ncbi:MAG: hypothetical protein GQ583_04610 [Methyloprofundus sp.]|nr:hypothetical protein [Methyloprofundus sp.]